MIIILLLYFNTIKYDTVGNDDEGGGGSETEEQHHPDARTEGMFPSVEQQHDETTGPTSQNAPVTTLHHLIALRSAPLFFPL